VTPAVSVVVATRNREARLADLLASLRAQTMQDFEVVIVDDASTDGTPQVLEAEVRRGDLDLRTIRREAARGPAQARNAGWRAATAPLIAFTDDDCVADPRWLEEGLAAWGGDPQRFVQGHVSPIYSERDQLGALAYSIYVEGPSPMFETANIFYPRDLLERVGGFDETFARPSGEDCDLGWRAKAAGAEPAFAAGARVQHAVIVLTPRQMLQRMWRWSDAIRPYARHPELRRSGSLHLGIFWNWSHYLLLRALIALPLLRRRWGWPVALWLGGRFVAYEIEQSRKEAGTAWLAPWWMVRDTVETAACVRGAVRYRVPVL
jgi:glycosyltransferase involved in cell wall biosynthesis